MDEAKEKNDGSSGFFKEKNRYVRGERLKSFCPAITTNCPSNCPDVLDVRFSELRKKMPQSDLLYSGNQFLALLERRFSTAQVE
jgi:hypothetical protein